MLKAQLERKVEAAGFKDIEVIWGKDVFSGAPQHSDTAKFGTLGVTILASKENMDQTDPKDTLMLALLSW